MRVGLLLAGWYDVSKEVAGFIHGARNAISMKGTSTTEGHKVTLDHCKMWLHIPSIITMHANCFKVDKTVMKHLRHMQNVDCHLCNSRMLHIISNAFKFQYSLYINCNKHSLYTIT